MPAPRPARPKPVRLQKGCVWLRLLMPDDQTIVLVGEAHKVANRIDQRLTLQLLIETPWRDLITSGGTIIEVTKAAGTLDCWVEWMEDRAG
ncbi:MAG: hypothetical protein P8R54_19280 [Myxococcota bacterium]|nr:hypothetical protein [Myxococcota bacterium]